VDSPASHRISVPRGTQELDESLISFAYGAVTLCDGTFQNPSARNQFGNSHMPSPTTPLHLTAQWFGLFPVRSPLLGEWFPFLEVLRCFSSPGALPRLRAGPPTCCGGGYPIRKSAHITPVDGSTRLIAANHVLLRPLAPRHPPCALSSFTLGILTN